MDCAPNYERIAAKHNVPREHLRFMDRVPTDQVPYWMRACDVVTIPWTWNEFSAYYTSPMKLFEYMAAGRCVVASRLGQIEEVIEDGHNGLLCQPDDAEALATALLRVRRNDALLRRLGVAARQCVEREYTWHKAAQTIEKLIRGRAAGAPSRI